MAETEKVAVIEMVMDKDNKCYHIYGVIDGTVSYSREGIASNDEFRHEYMFLVNRGYKILDRFKIEGGVKVFVDRKTWGSRFDGILNK